MICTVIDIRGDYAYVRYADTGVVSEVAIALQQTLEKMKQQNKKKKE